MAECCVLCVDALDYLQAQACYCFCTFLRKYSREWFIQKFLHGHAWFEFREVIRFLIFFYSVPMFLSGSVILAICNVPCSLPMVARCWVFGWKWFPWMCHFLDLVVEKWFLGSSWHPKGTIFEWSSSSGTIYCFKVRKATACGLQLGRENPKHWRKHFWNLASCSAYEDSLERMKKICEERFLCVHRLRNHQYGEIGFVEESRMTSAGWGYSLSLSLFLFLFGWFSFCFCRLKMFMLSHNCWCLIL